MLYLVSNSMDVLYWIAGLLGLAAVIAAAVYLCLRGLRRAMGHAGERRVAARFRPDEVRRTDAAACFFGLGSRGKMQLRGNGVLVLTPSSLWFGAHVLRKEIDIPLDRVRAASLASSHLGKKVLGRELLHVRFATGTGEDTAAWLVDEPRRWTQEIQQQWRGRAPGREGDEHGQGEQRV